MRAPGLLARPDWAASCSRFARRPGPEREDHRPPFHLGFSAVRRWRWVYPRGSRKGQCHGQVASTLQFACRGADICQAARDPRQMAGLPIRDRRNISPRDATDYSVTHFGRSAIQPLFFGNDLSGGPPRRVADCRRRLGQRGDNTLIWPSDWLPERDDGGVSPDSGQNISLIAQRNR